ncbi:SphA family protein [Telmatospirillum siberiense]|uniref:Phenol degradation protein meta n=1 Tax=Telmatospirillum siberiense TaxID=382514 RepID=A0A2N3Q0K3_9PROT|nr:transporter [Telmatospirillum siberiense]PKU26121.1 hypothetical protein CWS72_03025 [Telmatospirillum siberiense]
MNQLKTLGPYACLVVALAMAPLGAAYGEEKKSPMMPGGSAGNAAGALPPEGLYFNNEVTIEQGKLVDGEGRTSKTPAGTNVKAFQVDVTPSLLWVPGVKVLGASYGVAITQPYAWLNTDFGGASTGGDSTSNKGFFNTILTPAILSWDVGNGIFIGSGLSVYVKDGHFTHHYSAAQGRETLSNGSFANNYWTFQPNFAVSYLANGWNLTMNHVVDFNTKNDVTNYQSGNAYYLDLTATKKFGPWEFGAIGNILEQWQPDKVRGVKVAAVDGLSSAGNQSEVLAMGPLVAYNFGKASLRLRYLQPIRSENQGDISFIRLDLSVPLY